jgi:hypothetical protein
VQCTPRCAFRRSCIVATTSPAKQISSERSLVATPFVFFMRKGNRLDAIEAYEHIKALSVRMTDRGVKCPPLRPVV